MLIISALAFINGLSTYGKEVIKGVRKIDKHLVENILNRDSRIALELLEDGKRLEGMKQAGLYSGRENIKGQNRASE